MESIKLKPIESKRVRLSYRTLLFASDCIFFYGFQTDLCKKCQPRRVLDSRAKMAITADSYTRITKPSKKDTTLKKCLVIRLVSSKHSLRLRIIAHFAQFWKISRIFMGMKMRTILVYVEKYRSNLLKMINFLLTWLQNWLFLTYLCVFHRKIFLASLGIDN